MIIKKLFLCFFFSSCLAHHYPIQFSIPESKVVQAPLPKDRDFAFLIPGNAQTYIFSSEEEYCRGYQRSYFAVTGKKGGWDCMRHYEILANGCIPYFVNLEECPPNTLYFLPKDLIQEAMHLPGVCYETLTINHAIFDRAKYDKILAELLDYTRKHLTTRAMAEYLLQTIGYTGEKPILFIVGRRGSGSGYVDYLQTLCLIGLKEVLGNKLIDFPRLDCIYKDYPDDVSKFYGKGFSYTKILESDNTDRNEIRKRIKAREFSHVIYGLFHETPGLYNLTRGAYQEDEIVYLCGADEHECKIVAPFQHLFLREFQCLKAEPIIVLP